MKNEVVIVAFGDSLTVGYQSPTLGEEFPRPAPYTEFLDAMTKRFKQGSANVTKVEFLNMGIVGELTDDMLDRFESDVVRLGPDFVIVLGGSNDLGWGVEPEAVAGNLKEMYGQALNHDITPIACTVPSVLGYDEGIPPRIMLNRLIRRYSTELDLTCVGLFEATSDSAGRLREEYSNDGLHMTAEGYERIAEVIFLEAVRSIVLGS